MKEFSEDAGIKGICALKRQMRLSLDSAAIVREPVPISYSEKVPYSTELLDALHRFVRANPIYEKSYQVTLGGIPCLVYDGDNTRYWLQSKKQDSNYQPFYSTWLLSALALAVRARSLGYIRIVDIGAGDGRLPYCAKVIGLESHAIEVDGDLVLLQKKLCTDTLIEFNAVLADATQFDYQGLDLDRTLFFISALPEHGEMIARSVLHRVLSSESHDSVGFALMGSFSKRSLGRDQTSYGWGDTIRENGLIIDEMIALPTQWTSDIDIDTPYLFTSTGT